MDALDALVCGTSWVQEAGEDSTSHLCPFEVFVGAHLKLVTYSY